MADRALRLVEEVEIAVEAIRIREVERALRRLGLNGDFRGDEVEVLAQRVCHRILSPVLSSIRLAAGRKDRRTLHAAERLFGVNGHDRNRDRR